MRLAFLCFIKGIIQAGRNVKRERPSQDMNVRKKMTVDVEGDGGSRYPQRSGSFKKKHIINEAVVLCVMNAHLLPFFI